MTIALIDADIVGSMLGIFIALVFLFLMWWTEPTEEQLDGKRARQEDY